MSSKKLSPNKLTDAQLVKGARLNMHSPIAGRNEVSF